MATFLSSEHMKLSEVLQHSNYTAESIFVKSLEKKSKLMQILPWYPTSNGDVHKGTYATKLPKGAFGAFNKAIPTSTAATAEYEKNVKFYELKSDVDERFFEGLGTEKANKLRASKDRLYSMGFMQGLAEEIVTNPGTDPKSTIGLIPQRKKLGTYCFDAGGSSGKLGSFLFIRPGEDGVNLRYPDSASPNFIMKDNGRVQALEIDSSGKVKGTYPALETLYRCYYVLDNPDESALVRVANVPADTALTDVIIDMLVDVVNELPNQGEGYIAVAPQALVGQFWKYLNKKDNIAFSKREVEKMGKPDWIFNVPFFAEEYMTTDESKVS